MTRCALAPDSPLLQACHPQTHHLEPGTKRPVKYQRSVKVQGFIATIDNTCPELHSLEVCATGVAFLPTSIVEYTQQ
jgi:hypothetical protein